MKIGPKYKIARRLGAPIFEKTQTQKFAARAEKKAKSKGFSRPKSEYAFQHNEKQKARFQYGISEKQFSTYVKTALEKKSSRAVPAIFEALESRLDNIVYRLGFAKTRRAARQMVSHGHIVVNGKKTTIPSRAMKIGDIVTPRVGSMSSVMFTTFPDRFDSLATPDWMIFDIKKMQAEIKGAPKLGTDMLFDLNAVVEFYSR